MFNFCVYQIYFRKAALFFIKKKKKAAAAHGTDGARPFSANVDCGR